MEKLKPSLKRISLSLGIVLLLTFVASYALAFTQNNGTVSLITNNSDDSENHEDLIKQVKKYKLKFYWSHIVQDEYSPVLQADLSSWKEDIQQVKVSKSLDHMKNISLGWLESTIVQKNHYYNDIDFSLQRQSLFFHFQFPVTNQISASLCGRDEKFTNDSNNGYFQLDGPQHIFTGYLRINYQAKNFWMNFNYSREHESDPIYDPITKRAVLNIEVKELTGILAGIALAENLEIGSGIYYEKYGFNKENQFNPNIQVSYLPSWLTGTRLSLGTGYYTKEKETIINLAIRYNWQPIKKINLDLEYQLEYSHNEEAWLNQGDLMLSWYIFNHLYLTLETSYGREYGGDKDEFFSIQIGPVWNFF